MLVGKSNPVVKKILATLHCHFDCHSITTIIFEITKQALRKYHRLNVKHDTTVQELVNKTEALIHCYKGTTIPSI